MTSSQIKTAVERLRVEGAKRPREEKEQLGQFLTPVGVAGLVASLFQSLSPSRTPLRLLDPGAGTGALSFAFVNWIVQQEHLPTDLEIVAVELDKRLIPLLNETLKSCETLGATAGVRIRANVVHSDFLKLCSEEAGLFASRTLLREFTHVIMNPPYRKIASESEERKLLSRNGIEVSNIYAGFVALGAELLGQGGELAAITPRSFCNGTYFKDFRRRLFSSMVLEAAHVFVSRQKAFSEDSVLQENVIFAARKTKAHPGCVSVRTSDGPGSAPTENLVPYSTVLAPHDRDMVIHLPANDAGIQAMEFVTALPERLESVGLSVSTGPVVDFRARKYLCVEPSDNTVPLLYPAHFSRNGIEWPKQGRKPNAIVVSPQTAWSLVPTGNYVLVKRFSSKEEKKRITARVLESNQLPPYSHVGLENHLNFLHSEGRGLDSDLSFGLATYLNSTVVDVYFRQFNGHTQVNAGDLRMMRFPDVVTLRQLGVAAQEDRAAMYDQERVDELVQQVIGSWRDHSNDFTKKCFDGSD
jgi:adenine-specific DNA-methyltransferase